MVFGPRPASDKSPEVPTKKWKLRRYHRAPREMRCPERPSPPPRLRRTSRVHTTSDRTKHAGPSIRPAHRVEPTRRNGEGWFMDTGSAYGSDGASRVTVWEADGSPWTGVGYGSELARRLARSRLPVSVVPLQDRRPDEEELAAPLHVLSGGTTPATPPPDGSAPPTARSPGCSIVRCRDSQRRGGVLRCAAPRGGARGAPRRPAGPTGDGGGAVQGPMLGVRGRSCGERVPPPRDPTGCGSQCRRHAHVRQRAQRGPGLLVGSTIAGFQFHPELDPRRTASTIHANRT